MPEALTVAGLQHVVNNLCSDVHQGMKHWQAFHAQLKSLEALLRIDERRQRFAWTCLHGTPLDAQSFRFSLMAACMKVVGTRSRLPQKVAAVVASFGPCLGLSEISPWREC